MPVAELEELGLSYYYEDSGSLEGCATYTTVVMVHGAGFHGGIFKRTLPHAAGHRLRFIAPYMRDYPGSTPYSPDELKALHGDQREAIKSRGLELGAFLMWLIDAGVVIPLSNAPDAPGERIGGAVLLGWSAGNCHTTALLGHADDLSERTKTLLGKHLRTFIMYDGSHTSLGEQSLEGLPNVLRDPALSTSEKIRRFPVWHSSYFPKITLEPASDPETFQAFLMTRTPIHDADDASQDTYNRAPTVERMTAEVFQSVYHEEALLRSQMLILLLNREVYRENFSRAMFGHGRSVLGADMGEPLAWPHVDVQSIWCDMSTSESAYAVQRMYQMKRDATIMRSIAFHRLEDANHFAHWDEPERFVRMIADVLSSSRRAA